MGKKTSATADGKGNVKNLPFGGYYQRDVPAPDPELTSSDPGTPMGELMRRQWQPVCLSEELSDLVHPVRIMGEDLVVFRDHSRSIGVLHRNCSHRGASLEFGLIQEHGVRCCYHGWWFDVDGTILETPGQPEHARIKESLCHGAYPAFERYGMVFAYMGPPELKPDFPIFDTIEVLGNELYSFSNFYPCNWLQIHENVCDQLHTAIFHNGMGNRVLVEGVAPSNDVSLPAPFTSDDIPIMDYELTDGGNGMISTTVRRVDDKVWVRHNHYLIPNYLEIAGLFEDMEQQKYFAGIGHVRWHVPHDDTHASVFGIRHFNAESDPKSKGDPLKLGVGGGDFLFGQTGDRSDEVRHRYPGDWDVVSSQRPIAVHAKENLASSDRGVAMLRKMCRDALHDRVPDAWPKPANGGETRRRGYTNDTIFNVPALDDAEADFTMLEDIGRQVTAIIVDQSLEPGKDRRGEVKKRLKALEKEFQRQMS